MKNVFRTVASAYHHENVLKHVLMVKTQFGSDTVLAAHISLVHVGRNRSVGLNLVAKSMFGKCYLFSKNANFENFEMQIKFFRPADFVNISCTTFVVPGKRFAACFGWN